MKQAFKNLLPYLITSLLVIGWWKMWAWTDNYAFSADGVDLQKLESALTSIYYYKMPFWLILINMIVLSVVIFYNKAYKTSAVIGVSALALYFLVEPAIAKKCAPYYYVVFQNQSIPEELIIRPITEAGYPIGPILLKEIQNKNMKSRTYAILGLQEIGYKPATDLMRKILVDKTESKYFRADAFETLMAFGTEESLMHVEKFKSSAKDSVEMEVVRLGEYFYSSRED